MSVLYVLFTTKLFFLSKNVLKHDPQGFFVCLSHWVVVGELSQLPNNKGNQMFQKMSAGFRTYIMIYVQFNQTYLKSEILFSSKFKGNIKNQQPYCSELSKRAL